MSVRHNAVTGRQINAADYADEHIVELEASDITDALGYTPADDAGLAAEIAARIAGDAALDAAKAPLAHTHDDRYYTETEINSILAAYAQRANNLSDLNNAATARANLGLVIGTNVQAFNARLAELAAIAYAQGDILYFNGTNLVRLPAGSAGNLLQSGGAAANPSWVAPSSTAGVGAMSLIARATPNGVSSVSFPGIPATFTHLYLTVSGRSSAVAVNVVVQVQFNGDTGANYDFQHTQFSGATVTAAASMGLSNIQIGLAPGASASANYAGYGTGYIFNYADTNLFKTGKFSAAFQSGTASGNVTAREGQVGWRSTAAINRLDVLLSSGNFTAGSSVSLYGAF